MMIKIKNYRFDTDEISHYHGNSYRFHDINIDKLIGALI
jgi:hypothetical protein